MIDEPFYSKKFILNLIKKYEIEFVILHTDFISFNRIVKTFFIYRFKKFFITVLYVLKNIVVGGEINNILKKYKIKTIKTGKVNSDEVFEFTENNQIDVLISFNCPEKIKKRLLDKPSKIPINIHLGYLPSYRGVFPVFHAFINKEKYVGTSIHIMNENFDDGKILIQEKVEVEDNDDMLTLYDKIFSLIPNLTLKVLRDIETGATKLIPNGPQNASYYSFPTFKEVFKYRKMTSSNSLIK